MIEHLLLHLGQYLTRLWEQNTMDAHDKAVARNEQRRIVAHADIPPMETVERTYGARFDELMLLMSESDPAQLHTRRSKNARDWKHAALVQRRYRMLTWTLIHRLAKADTAAEIKPILEVELSLWFDADLDQRDLENANGLLPRLANWRRRWDFA